MVDVMGSAAIGLAPPPSSPRGTFVTNGRTSYSTSQAVAAINRVNLRWAAPVGGGIPTITYAFRNTGTPPGTYGGFSQFNTQQMEIANLMLSAWSDVAAINFTRVGTGSSGVEAYSDSATMLFGNYSTGSEDAAGFAYYPGSTASTSVSGDIWINARLSYEIAPAVDNYGAITFLHEIGHAIGLSHPGSYDAGEGVTTAAYYEDSRQYSVMSYLSESTTGGSFKGQYAFTPLLDDIAAAQALYGARTQRTGDTIYGFNSNTGLQWYSATSATTKLVFAAWDSGGTDMFDFSLFGDVQKIDLRTGQFSNVGGLTGNVTIAYGVTIENARGGTGGDIIIGNAANNALFGNGGGDTLYGADGNDNLYGGDGDDILDGGNGTNLLDGGEGNDALLLEYSLGDYIAYSNGDGTATVTRGPDLRNIVVNIESVRLGSTTTSFATFLSQSFDGLRYIASHADLIGLGANATAGAAHFQNFGRVEGRTVTFDAFEYAASNLDLARTFGMNVTALSSHYINFGFREGRPTTTFDELLYGASNADLARSMGADNISLRQHYVGYGLAEGRPTSGFDPYAYAIANRDIVATVGLDRNALVLNYVQTGAVQNRPTSSSFSALRYAASNPDLIRSTGTNVTALQLHYLQYGFAEGRSITRFDAIDYAIANPDLYRTMGTNVDVLTQHYVLFGFGEGRSSGIGFNPLQYAASNRDLALSLGVNTTALSNHYLQFGLAERRPVNTFQAPLYVASNTDLARAFGTNFDAALAHYITSGIKEGRPTTTFDAVSYMLGNSAQLGRGVNQSVIDYLTNRAFMLANPFGRIGTDQTGSHAIAPDSTTNSAFEIAGDRDWFEFSLTSRRAVSIRLAGAVSSTLDTYLYLHDATGRLLSVNNNSGGGVSALISQTLNIGTYYVVAGTLNDTSSGSYRLTLSTAAAASTAAAPVETAAYSMTSGQEAGDSTAPSPLGSVDTIASKGDLSENPFAAASLAATPALVDTSTDPFSAYAFLLGAEGGLFDSVSRYDGSGADQMAAGLAASAWSSGSYGAGIQA